MNGWARVAHLGRTRNLNGGLVCTAADGLPFLLSAGLAVRFVPPTLRGPRGAVVQQVAPLHSGQWEVVFEGVDSADVAQDLVGSYCLARIEDIPSFEDAQATPSIVGYAVHDTVFGHLGTVTDVLENPAQATIVCAGEAGQVLVPWVDAYVDAVDDQAQCVCTSLPESLITLNAAQPFAAGERPAAAQVAGTGEHPAAALATAAEQGKEEDA